MQGSAGVLTPRRISTRPASTPPHRRRGTPPFSVAIASPTPASTCPPRLRLLPSTRCGTTPSVTPRTVRTSRAGGNRQRGVEGDDGSRKRGRADRATWNPTTGCHRVSSGCDHCYALTLVKGH
ncbi:DUF5131 family protein [Puerhibacterium sp. TATVAM-FAB25]|uniref:DUF5131 family protein n=1 Tax=Puerhibacterium sp. TATVAM-FAB25 TaxID=3093699 RepID=UPI00397C8383